MWNVITAYCIELQHTEEEIPNKVYTPLNKIKDKNRLLNKLENVY